MSEIISDSRQKTLVTHTNPQVVPHPRLRTDIMYSTRYSRAGGEGIWLSQASVDCEGRGRGYDRHRDPRARVRDSGGEDGAGSGGGDGSIDRKEVRAGTVPAPPKATDADAALSPGSRGARAKYHSRGL